MKIITTLITSPFSGSRLLLSIVALDISTLKLNLIVVISLLMVLSDRVCQDVSLDCSYF